MNGRPRSLPVDLDAALLGDDWRDGFAWPIPHDLVRNLDEGPDRAFLNMIEADSDDLARDILLHAAPVVWMTSLGLLEHALLVDLAGERQLVGGPADIYVLLDRGVPSDIKFTAPLGHLPAAVPQAFARRIVRTKSWTPLAKLPLTLLAPDAIALSHNSLLVSEAGRSNERILFHHANSFLDDWNATEIPDSVQEMLRDRLDKVAAVFASHGFLSPTLADRVRRHLPNTLWPAVRRSAKAIIGMRNGRRLPSRIWAGTGGYFPARAIRIEARRRGGFVTGFDHGGTSAMVDEPFANQLLELSVTDRFVTQTAATADAIRHCAGDRTENFGGCEISGGSGDSAFRVAERPAPAAHSGKPRVLYVTGPFVGPLQRAQPRMPDVMKLDWQLRLVESLLRMPIDLLCQPHPEGALRGRPHPIGRLAPLSGRRFEEVVDWADVIVTDMVLSTTLWKSACREIPIVLLDLDMCDLNPAMMPILTNRFRIVRPTYDDRNRPVVDERELAEQILRPASPDEASAPFRALLAG